MWYETKIPPAEAPGTLGTYLRYTILNGYGLFGSVIFAGLYAAFAFLVTGLALQILIVITAAIIVWLAGYFLWKEERDAKAKLLLDLQIAKDEHDAAITRNRPKLVGKILQLGSRDWYGRKTKEGPANELLGCEFKIFLGISSVHPTPVQVLRFKLIFEHEGRLYESLGLPMKDGSLARQDSFKDLVALLSNESRRIEAGEYYEVRSHSKCATILASLTFQELRALKLS